MVVLTSVVAATHGCGVDPFAQLVPDMSAGFVIGVVGKIAGLALGSLFDRIGPRPAMLPAYGYTLPPLHAGPADMRQAC